MIALTQFRRLRAFYGRSLFCLLASVLGINAATFTASLDRNNIAVGENATLSLTFQGGTPRQLPSVQAPNLSIEYQGQSSQFTMINGQMSSSVSYNFVVTATRPGTYVIPSIQVEVDNQGLTSTPLQLQVTKSSTPNALAFLKLIPTKTTVYVGEVFAVEVQLYLGARQDSLQMPQIEGDGFVFGKMTQPTQNNVQVGNQIYTVGTFRASAVAVKTGTLSLGPAQCSLVLHVPIARNRTPFDFDSFFGGGAQRKPVTLSSEPQGITVLPLPKENQPPGFNGAVGTFTLSGNATPTNVAAGDPMTLRVQISGRGNLDALPFPDNTDWPEFKLYPPTSKTETSDPLGVTGAKTYERVLIPQNDKPKELPAISFSFFDPEKKKYETVTTTAIPVTIRPATTSQPQPTMLVNSNQIEESQPATRDIVHIKPYLGTVGAWEQPLLMRPWFLGIQSVPFIVLLSSWIWRKRREALENNPRLRRRLKVAETVRNGLKDLAQAASAREADTFFVIVFRLLQEQLGERLDLPASAITEAIVDERVQGHVPNELVSELHRLFQICNQARYAPQHSTAELLELVPQVEGALRQLRDLPLE
jgi:hypothetical protein